MYSYNVLKCAYRGFNGFEGDDEGGEVNICKAFKLCGPLIRITATAVAAPPSPPPPLDNANIVSDSDGRTEEEEERVDVEGFLFIISFCCKDACNDVVNDFLDFLSKLFLKTKLPLS